MSSAGSEQEEKFDLEDLSGHGTRLIVTQEGALDPSLLVRTEGYIYKKGGAVNARGGFRNWKKRWFVLVPVDFFGYQGYELQYFDAPNGNLKGTIALNDVDLFVESKSAHKKVKFEFQLVLQHGGELQLSCDSEDERDEWIRTLQVIINFLHKVATQPAMMLDGYDPMMEDDLQTYEIGEELAQNCQAFGPGLFGSEAGKSTQFVVTLYDLGGQRVSKGGMPVVATITNEDSIFYVALIDNDDGTYYANYVLAQTGKYQLSITLNEEHHIFGSPFDIEILPAKTIPKFCIAEGTMLTQMAYKSTQTFTILAMDGYGNRKTRGGDPFEVSILGPGQVLDLEDRNDGSYICTVSATQLTTANSNATSNYLGAGHALMIMITLYGKPIKGSPFKPVLTDAPLRNGSHNSHTAVAATVQPQPQEQSQSQSNSAALAQNVAVPSSTIGRRAAGGASQSSNSSVRTPPKPSASKTSNIPPTSNSVQSPSPSTPLVAPSVRSTPQQPQAVTSSTPASVPQSASTNPVPLDAATTAALQNTAGMSYLERSRQRALLAKSIAEQQRTGATAPPPSNTPQNTAITNGLARRLPPAAPAVTSGDIDQQPPQTPQQQPPPLTPGGSSSRLSQLAQRSKQTLEAKRAGQLPPPSVQQSQPQSSAQSKLQELADTLRQGLGSARPADSMALSAMEQTVWQQTHASLTSSSSPEVVDTLVSQAATLYQVFALFSERIEDQVLMKLTSGQGHGGLMKLLEIYEALPHFLNRLEAKTLFNLAVTAQV